MAPSPAAFCCCACWRLWSWVRSSGGFSLSPSFRFAETARLVSRYRDYRIRFTPSRRYSELVSLTEAFNEMLAEIQQRDAALEKAKAELELRVEERTAQLQAANRELEAFSYTVAHDLRGPLQSITNICYLIVEADRGTARGEARRPMLAQLSASVAAMSNTIDDLLDLSRSTSAALHLTHLDLSLLASSILEVLAKADPDRHVVEAVVQPRCSLNADPGSCRSFCKICCAMRGNSPEDAIRLR